MLVRRVLLRAGRSTTMKRLVILGAGTGGTMVANRMRKRLGADWTVTLVDPDPVHVYQPGLLFLPFSRRGTGLELVRARQHTIHHGIDWVQGTVRRIDSAARIVELEDDRLPYDLAVIASGT